MKRNFILSLFLFLICPLFSFAQDTPVWINNFENSIKQQESECKVESRNWQSEEGTYSFSLTLNCSGDQHSFKIMRLKDLPNGKETFEGLVISFDSSMGRNKKKTKLENFGDEGYIWVPGNKNSWTVLKFRKNDIFVDVFTSSEKQAKEFAGKIVNLLPKD